MKILIEMSMHRKDALNKLASYKDALDAHLAYIFAFSRENDAYKHWLRELGTICSEIDKITIKPNARKPSEDNFIELLLPHIDTTDDASVYLSSAWNFHSQYQDKLPPLSEMKFDSYFCKQYRDFRNKLNQLLLQLFCDDEKHTKEFFQGFIDEFTKNIEIENGWL